MASISVGAMTITSLRDCLTKRNTPHGGIPVGAVIVEGGICDEFISMLLKSSGEKSFKFPARDWIRELKVLILHLPVEAVVAIESSKELSDFMESKGIVFYPGVRPFDSILNKEILPTTAISDRHQVKRTKLEQTSVCTSSGCRFTFAELFAGIGGFRLGLEPLGGQCAFSSEIDTAAVNTYRANFNNTADTGRSMEIGDISHYYHESLPDFDILTGGFPCQPFSARGDQKGMLDLTKGQLFMELVRLLKNKKPKAFLFENVVGLVLMQGGKRSNRETAFELCEFVAGETFTFILQQFRECGYDVSWRVVNSRHWLPQFRERVYMVGFRKDLDVKPMNWYAVHGVSNQEEQRGDFEYFSSSQPSNNTAETSDVRPDSLTTVRDILQNEEDCAYIDTCELTNEQWKHVTNAVEKLSQQSVIKHEQNPETTIKGNNPRQFRSIPLDSKMPCIVSGYHRASSHTTKFIFTEKDGMERDGRDGNKNPRFLTPRECSRLMGFPDSFIIPDETSKQGRGLFYKQIGNAVCPPVIEAIGAQIIVSLGLS